MTTPPRPLLRQGTGQSSHIKSTHTVAAPALAQPSHTLSHSVWPSVATAAHASTVHDCGHKAGNNQTPVTLAKPRATPTVLYTANSAQAAVGV